MHLLTALSLKNRALIALVTIVAAVFGVIGAGSLKQELMPSVQFPTIAVVTSYPGASPEVVNNDVSVPIETALRGVPQLETSSATSSTGTSTVLAQFTYGVDLPSTEQKVERAISRISKALPEAADTQVLSGTIDDFPVIQIAVTPADGETPETTAALVERTVTPELSDLEGVRDAQLSGNRPDRISIRPNLDALAAQGLSAQSITDTLQQSGVLIAAGSVTEGDKTLAVQAGTELHSAEEIAALPLAVSPDQLAAQQAQQQAQALQPGQVDAPAAPAPVTLGAVADVQMEPGPEQSISRVNGAPALTIGVTKTSEANTVDVSHVVQQKLDDLQEQLGGAKLTVIFDQAPYVEQSIETLTTEGLLGLVFAVLVILVFLMSIRATLVTAISIPTSVLLTFVGLNFADYTLNLLTLGALTISIGRVVDDSIVVIENIKRHLTDGGDRGEVIVRAVREVAGAITASTVTTVAVFLPMAFVGGMVGELFRPFAFTVTIALVASLFVSLTIVPVLAYWFLRTGPSRRRRGFVTAGSGAAPTARAAAVDRPGEEIDTHPTALQRGYRPIIEWTLRRPAITLLMAVVVFAGTIAATPLMKTNFIGSDEQNSVGLVQNLAPGTSLDAQLAQAERVEQALTGVASIDSVQVTIGSAGGAAALLGGGGGDGVVNYSITTDPDADQSEMQDRIRDAVDGLDDAGEFSIAQSGGGVTSSSAIEVNVTGPDQKTLSQASDAVVTALRKESSLQQVESDLGVSRQFLRISVDRGLAAQAGLTEAGVAQQVAQQMQPTQVGQITVDADTVSVYLVNATEPTDQAGVAALAIQTATGPQALSSLASVEVADGPVTVRTENGVRSVTVSALPKGDDLGTASADVTSALETVTLPAGANAAVGGVLSQQADAFQQLGLALLAAILIVYVVMVATFRSLLQPLLLLVSVPFAATGALLLLIATGIPLGVASLIGVLMLVGIVVTNAIVLIDLVNQYRIRGDALRDAVLHGSLQRLRPIVMTALATILALTPMALGITGKGGFISQPLAVVVIGGLLSSTVLTLVVLPTLYYLVERRREGGPRRGGEAPRRRRTRGPRGPVLAGAAGAAAVGGSAAALTDVAASGAAHADAPAPLPAPEPVASSPTPAHGIPEVPVEPSAAAAAHGDTEVPAHADPEPLPAPVSAPISGSTPEPVAPEAEPAADPVEPVIIEPAAVHAPEPMGPSTEQMSLALSDLGFTGTDNPLSELAEPVDAAPDPEASAAQHAEPSHAPEPFWEIVPESAPGAESGAVAREQFVHDGDLSEETPSEPLVPASAAESESVREDATAPAPEPAPVLQPEVSPLFAESPTHAEPAEAPSVLPGSVLPDSVLPGSEPETAPEAGAADELEVVPGEADPLPAPPITGELDWEQLMWQATQEIDEPETAAQAPAASPDARGEDEAEAPGRPEGTR